LCKELGLGLELSHFKGVRIYTIMVEDYSADYSYCNKEGIEIICGDSEVFFLKVKGTLIQSELLKKLRWLQLMI
jgi:hypothetical protein